MDLQGYECQYYWRQYKILTWRMRLKGWLDRRMKEKETREFIKQFNGSPKA